jgi:hypothetical protein
MLTITFTWHRSTVSAQTIFSVKANGNFEDGPFPGPCRFLLVASASDLTK